MTDLGLGFLKSGPVLRLSPVFFRRATQWLFCAYGIETVIFSP